jgi:hypothetical protein
MADVNGGAAFASSVGQFKDGTLELTSAQARSFTVTLTEVPGREPLAYFSMDDVLADKRPLPVSGVKGRALAFDGKKSQFNTGVNTDALAKGATFALWVKAKDSQAKDQVVLGGRAGEQEFALGWNVGNTPGFSYRIKDAQSEGTGSTASEADTAWHYLAMTFDGKQLAIFYDGQKTGGAGATLPAKAPIFLGSVGGAKFAAATLDEVRIYDRVLADEEIRALYENDRKAAPASASK